MDGVSMTRYTPARHYLTFGIVAVGLSAFSGWLGMDWVPAFVPAALFFLSAILLFVLAFRPAVEIHEGYLAIGKRVVPWMDIRRLDRPGSWISPLIVRMTLFDDSRLILVYPGDLDSCNSLLRHLRRLSRDALITAYLTASIGVKSWPPEAIAGRSRPHATGCCVRRTRPKSSASINV